MSEPLLTIRMV